MSQHFEVDGKSYPLQQLRLEISALNSIAWLSQHSLYPKVYWQEEKKAQAAVGNLLAFPHVPHVTSARVDVRFYGGMRFGKKHLLDETWRGFPQTCFWLPQVEIVRQEEKTEILVNALGETPSASWAQIANFDNAIQESTSPPLILRKEIPEFPLWQKNIERVLEEISAGHLAKLVLARKSELHFASPLDPWPLVFALAQRARKGAVFAYQLNPHTCFLGASPEKFFQREKNHFQADAIAGTRPRGTTAEEDFLQEQKLLSSLKEQREFQHVRDFLEMQLHPFSENMKWQFPTSQIIKTSHLHHFHNCLSVYLKPGIADKALIEALHPTPALGGLPREKALTYLNELEPFDRGWYGAPLGFVSPQETNLYVAIRSGLIQGRTLHLFAGAGIVEGSIAEREWEEVEYKIRPFLELLTEGCPC